MLQPMQPVGQQQKPGTNIGMPKAPGQQMLPAGAAMQRGILPGGIASNPEDIKAAYGGTPQGQQKLAQAQQQGDYLSAIALAQILEEEREKAAQKAAQATQGGKPAPVMDRMRGEAVELRRQDLEEQQAKRLGVEQQRSQSAIAQMAQQAARPQLPGIAGLPAQNVAQPQAMAAGGIVAFEGGGDVERKATEEEVRPVGPNPYAGLSNRQIVERYGREQLGTDRAEAERRKREEYMKFAGYSPEERAAQQKRIAEMEAYDREAYDPERLRNEGLAAFLMGAANTGGIGETLARAGQSGLGYSNKMRELARQRLTDRQKKAEEFMEAERGVRMKGFEAGEREGKEVLSGQRQGIAGLGDVLQAEASAARAAGTGGDVYTKVGKLIAMDPTIRKWNKSLELMEKNGEVDTPEYRKIQQDIADREAQYYEKYKVEGILPPAQKPEAPPEEEKPSGLASLFRMPWMKSKEQLTGAAPQLGGSALPPGIPPGSVKIGTSGGNPVYQTPDGKKLVVKP